MLKDIESLIHHFVNVTRGMKIPRGEAYAACEIPRGEQGYYVVSDGLGHPYRLRVRGPGFANVQVMPIAGPGRDHRRSDCDHRLGGLHSARHRPIMIPPTAESLYETLFCKRHVAAGLSL